MSSHQTAAETVLDRYDAGPLSDGGGGNVDWWWDYMRAELERAHEFYEDQFSAAQENLAQAGPALLRAPASEVVAEAARAHIAAEEERSRALAALWQALIDAGVNTGPVGEAMSRLHASGALFCGRLDALRSALDAAPALPDAEGWRREAVVAYGQALIDAEQAATKARAGFHDKHISIEAFQRLVHEEERAAKALSQARHDLDLIARSHAEDAALATPAPKEAADDGQ